MMSSLKTFPSPCGDYGSYHFAEKVLRATYEQVSVPLRGLWFLSPEMWRNR